MKMLGEISTSLVLFTTLQLGAGATSRWKARFKVFAAAATGALLRGSRNWKARFKVSVGLFFATAKASRKL